jgi:hypothetical protein
MLPRAGGFSVYLFGLFGLIALERKLALFTSLILQESGPSECTELRKISFAEKLLVYPIPAAMGSS